VAAHDDTTPTVARFVRPVRLVRLARRDRVAGIAAVAVAGALVAAAIGYGGGPHAVLPRLADVGAWLTNDGHRLGVACQWTVGPGAPYWSGI
jgi:hypothetical protein